MTTQQRGQSTLYAIILMPILLLVVSLVADVGSLQVERVRLTWAQDTALVDAVTEIDSANYAATGQLRIDESATTIYRQYLVANLESMRGALAGGATPESIAAEAEVVVVDTVPGVDPFSGRALDRPAICARLRAPFSGGLLRLGGIEPIQDLTVTGDAEMRAEGA